jgi:hypothetical protein
MIFHFETWTRGSVAAHAGEVVRWDRHSAERPLSLLRLSESCQCALDPSERLCRKFLSSRRLLYGGRGSLSLPSPSRAIGFMPAISRSCISFPVRAAVRRAWRMQSIISDSARPATTQCARSSSVCTYPTRAWTCLNSENAACSRDVHRNLPRTDLPRSHTEL